MNETDINRFLDYLIEHSDSNWICEVMHDFNDGDKYCEETCMYINPDKKCIIKLIDLLSNE